MSKKVEKPKRGLFIDFEGFIQSSNDENFIKNFSSELNKNFKLFTFIDIPKEKSKDNYTFGINFGIKHNIFNNINNENEEKKEDNVENKGDKMKRIQQINITNK